MQEYISISPGWGETHWVVGRQWMGGWGSSQFWNVSQIMKMVKNCLLLRAVLCLAQSGRCLTRTLLRFVPFCLEQNIFQLLLSGGWAIGEVQSPGKFNPILKHFWHLLIRIKHIKCFIWAHWGYKLQNTRASWLLVVLKPSTQYCSCQKIGTKVLVQYICQIILASWYI